MISRRTRAGRSDGDDSRRNVACDDAPGADHRVVADRHPLHDHRVTPDPDVVADPDRQRTHDTRIALLRKEGVVDGVKPHVGTDEDMVADRDGGFVEDREVEIAHEMVADRNLLAEIAMERAVQAHRLADVSEQPADDCFALFAAARRQPVQFEYQLLGAPPGPRRSGGRWRGATARTAFSQDRPLFKSWFKTKTHPAAGTAGCVPFG